MKDREKIGEYVAAFTGKLIDRLAAGIEIKTIVHPANLAGAVIEILLEKNAGGEVQYLTPTETINDAISGVDQNLVSGDLSGITFSGTNISMSNNRIVLIKGEDADGDWSENSAVSDLNRIFHLSEGGE